MMSMSLSTEMSPSLIFAGNGLSDGELSWFRDVMSAIMTYFVDRFSVIVI